MKKRPSGAKDVGALREKLSVSAIKRSLDVFLDRCFVRMGWMPEIMDGTGRVLHISDTPTNMYKYLARLLRRVNPSVIIHTGDLADDIKLEMYRGEKEHYRAAVSRLMDIMQFPHRRIIIALGNHDCRELLPHLPVGCVICDNVMDIELFGETFCISHYMERTLDSSAKFNLFGHSPEHESNIDSSGRYFINGLELIRLIEPQSADIKPLQYPAYVEYARTLSTGRRFR